MGTGEGAASRRENGGRRRRRLDGDDDDDEEYVLEEEEEDVEELSASSAGEEGEESDAEYEQDEEDRELELEDETPLPRRPVKGRGGGRRETTNPAAARSRRRRYEDDDDYEEELEEDEEIQKYRDELEEDEQFEGYREEVEEEPRPKEIQQYRDELEEDEQFEEYREEDEEEPRPKRPTKCGGHGRKGKLPMAAARSRHWRLEGDGSYEDDDMDFNPGLDEELNTDLDGEEEDMDFDPEMDDGEELEDEEDEELGAIHTRKVRVKNPVKRKPILKRRRRNKKSSSKVSRRKVDSAKTRKAAPLRRRRKRSMIVDYEEEDDFIVEDQTVVNRRRRKRPMIVDCEEEDDFIVEDQTVVNRQPRKKARVGRQTEVDPPVPVVEAEAWPLVDSDTSDFEFLTSDEEPEDMEPAAVEPMRITVKKGKRNRISGSESSSDSEFLVSDKELRDLRETGTPEALPMLPALPRRTSVTRDGEDKGKEKKEPEETGKPTCGICLSEEQRTTVQGVLSCCSHYFCFGCIMEWSRVESRCPLCKQRFRTITKSTKMDLGLGLRKDVIRVEKRDQVYQPTEEEIRRWLDPYENVVCIECNQGGDDSLMLLCDICDSSAHTYCVGLGREVPEGNWYCGGCRFSGEGPSCARIQHTVGYQRENNRSPVDGSSEGFGTFASNGMFQRPPSIDTQHTFQGIDLNLTPRENPGENRPSESQVPSGGVSTPSGRHVTLSGRRQIHQRIRILLSRPRPTITPDVPHNGTQHNGVIPRTEPNNRNFHSSKGANSSETLSPTV